MVEVRRRRSSNEAKTAILDAAEEILIRDGPDGVVVQRVAAAVGVTDAAVHYHFGNRRRLMEALLHHCGRKLVEEIAEAAGSGQDGFDLAPVSRAMLTAYDTRGAARMAMWLRMAGWRSRGAGMLSPLIAQAEAAGGADVRRLIALLNLTHIAMAIMGDALLRAADLPADADGQAEYLAWVTDLVGERLARGA